MTDVDARRFEMHSGLKEALGDDVANTLMEHLPYGGSSRVATKDDITDVRRDIERLDSKFDQVFERMDRSDRRFMWFAGIVVAVCIGLFAVDVQIMFSIANLSATINK